MVPTASDQYRQSVVLRLAFAFERRIRTQLAPHLCTNEFKWPKRARIRILATLKKI